jgi:hypothetical protein
LLDNKSNTDGRPAGLNDSVLTSTDVAEFLVEVPDVPNLSVFCPAMGASSHDEFLVDSVARHVRTLLRAAASRGDWVVIDTAPLGEVSDALPIATEVSDVLLVVRARHTDRRSVVLARDQLERAGVRPQGMLIVDDKRSSRTYYPDDGFARGEVRELSGVHDRSANA